jgi:hypothetical protein
LAFMGDFLSSGGLFFAGPWEGRAATAGGKDGSIISISISRRASLESKELPDTKRTRRTD